MACNCSGGSLGNTQSNLVAYVIPGGCGPLSDQLYAMSDSTEWPGIRVSNVTENLRGARTPIQRRSGRNPRKSIRCGVQEAAPAANSITVDVESCGCGGVDPSELIECEFDVLEYEVCCDAAGDPTSDFSKIKHWRGISIENNQYSNRVSFDSADNNTLMITHAGEFESGHTYYQIGFNEIAMSAGIDTGGVIADLKFSDAENCGTSGCGRRIGCGDQWYAITDTGNLIYKAGPGENIQEMAVAGWVASDFVEYTNIAIHRNQIYITTSSDPLLPVNIYIATINTSTGEPGAFTLFTDNNSIGFRPLGFASVGNDLWIFGQNDPGFPGAIFMVANNGVMTSIFENQLNTTGIAAADVCEGSVVLAGQAGTVQINSGCSNEIATLPSPTANNIRSVSFRNGNEIWVGDDVGVLHWSATNGQTWNQISLPASGFVRQLVWATPCVGYVAVEVGGVQMFYTTWNGGRDWTDSTDRLDTPPTDLDAQVIIRIPCCSNGTAQVNNIMLAGGNGADGMIYQGIIQNC